MYPAKRVIDAFGGPANLAEALGRDVSRIHRWTYPEERGGTGGAIPGGTKMLQTILTAAKSRRIDLTFEDLINAEPDEPTTSKGARRRRSPGKSPVSATA